MTTRSIRYWVFAGLLSTVQVNVFANPFACRLPPTVEAVTRAVETVTIATEKEIEVEAPLYKGYAVFQGRRFAVVQIGDQQHSLTTGDRIGSVTVLAITPDFLSYRFGQNVYQVPIVGLTEAE
jgi:hypothetical protein